MNEMIRYVANHGLEDVLYIWINNIGLIVAIIYSLWHGKKMGVPLWKMAIIVAGVYGGIGLVGDGIWVVVQHVRDVGLFGIETATNSIVRLFVFFPLIAVVLALILRLKWNLVCDSIVMYPLIRSCIGQLACVFPGCCRGLQWQGGIYNIKTGFYHFPTAIFETVLTTIILIYLVYRTKKKNYISDGSIYPLMMILYGGMRFYCEFLRENEKIILGCSTLAIHALFMCIVGVVWFMINLKRKEIDNEESIQTYEVEDNQGSEA